MNIVTKHILINAGFFGKLKKIFKDIFFVRKKDENIPVQSMITPNIENSVYKTTKKLASMMDDDPNFYVVTEPERFEEVAMQHHVETFNLDAISKNKTVRAKVVHWGKLIYVLVIYDFDEEIIKSIEIVVNFKNSKSSDPAIRFYNAYRVKN
jgi:hypothetical protein